MAEKRIIHTGVYSASAETMITRAMAFMRNNGARGVARTCSRTTVSRGDDGEVVLLYESHGYWDKCAWTTRRTDQACRDWLADYMKATAKSGILGTNVYGSYHDLYDCLVRKNDDWNPRNELLCPIVGIATDGKSDTFSVREVYCLYEILKGRKNVEGHFTPEMVAKFKGEARDPVQTEMAVARREAIDEIEAWLKAEKDAAEKEMYRRYDEVRAWRGKRVEELNKQAADRRAAVEKMFQLTEAADCGTAESETAAA